MKFGFTVMADIDEIGFFSHAETLGYSSVWVTDSQMLFSDCYVVPTPRNTRPGASRFRVAIAATCTGGMRVPQIAVPGPRHNRLVCRAASASTA